MGINYPGTKAKLNGCVNDVTNVQNYIVQYHGFQPDNITTLTDEGGNGNGLPTRANILNGMKWLVQGAKAGDSLVFHYSGHGGTARDLGTSSHPPTHDHPPTHPPTLNISIDGDECDNYDETILPCDFEQTGQILDDEIHAIMVAPLPAGVRLTAVFDSCHSGSAMDVSSPSFRPRTIHPSIHPPTFPQNSCPGRIKWMALWTL